MIFGDKIAYGPIATLILVNKIHIKIAIKICKYFDLEAFLKEIKALDKLDHPNMVKIIQAYQEKDTLFMIFEICNVGTLKELINDKNFNVT